MSLEKPTNDSLVDVKNTTSTTPPKSPTASDAELYPVEKLCRKRYDWHGKRWFRIKWEGTEERSWEPEENVAACLVKEFERKRKLRRKMKKGNSGKVKAEDGNCSDDVVLVGSKILPQFTCDFEGCVKVYSSLSSLRQHKTKVHFPIKVVKDSSKKTVEKEGVKEGKRKRDACKTVSSPSGDVKYYWICAQCNFEATSFRQLQQHKKGHTTTATSIQEGTVILETIPPTMDGDKPVEVESGAVVDAIRSEVEVGTGFGSRDSTQIISDVCDENEEIEAAASESSTDESSSETQVTEGDQEAEEVPITPEPATTVTVDSDLSSLVISSDSETEQGQMDTSDTSSSEVSNEPTPTGKKRKVAELEDQDQLMDIKSIKVEPEDVKPTPDSEDALYNAWRLAEKQYLDKLKKERDELKKLYEAEKTARLAEAAKVQDLEGKLKEEQSKIEALKITLGEALGKL